MNELRSYKTKEPSPRGRFFCYSLRSEKGNALLYVFLAVALLAALTYAYVKDSRENYASQSSVSVTGSLYSQINMIKSAVMECVAEYPAGGGDMNKDGTVDTNDNPNNPYPLAPSDAKNLNAGYSTISPNPNPNGLTGCTVNNVTGCIPQETGASPADQVVDLQCIGAPVGAAAMFTGASNQGRYLPPQPTGWTPWVYKNDATGVYIQITSPGDAASTIALTRLSNQFTSSQYSLSGNTFTAWILKN